MLRRHLIMTVSLLTACAWLVWRPAVEAQQGDPSQAARRADPARDTASDAAQPVVIQREPLTLVAPAQYHVSLKLDPIRTVRLAAPVAGIVRTLHVKPGQRVDTQAEAVQLDDTEQKLLFSKAKAMYRAAEIRVKRAAGQSEAELAELAEAELEAAKADMDLAEFRMQQASVRVPFTSTVFRIGVAEGQVVRPGDVLMTIGDTSRLTVEIPVDRKETQVGQSIRIRVEDGEVDAKVESILPVDARFEPLRDLVPSIASAAVVLDNASDRYRAGQTVYCALVPRQPVAELPTAAVTNMSGGHRKVQVVRENVIRDVQVELLGQVGVDRVFVSGLFSDGDEVIVNASQELPDGTQIRPQAAVASDSTPAATGRNRTSISSPSRGESARPKSGF